MASPTLAQVRTLIDDLWPESFAEPWDSVGLTVGDPAAPVTAILLAVDPTDDVVAEAAETSADLLLTHHPLLLRGVTSVAADTLKGGQVTRLLQAGVAHIAAHTNADSHLGGVSDALIDVLDAQVEGPLAPTAGAPDGVGIGRVGTVRPTTVRALAQALADALPVTATGVRIAGDPDAPVERVAVCGGAGDGLFDEVRASGAQVYVTSDLRHHPATEARDTAHRGDGTPHLIDISHWAAESLWLDRAASQLRASAAHSGWDVTVTVSTRRTDAWTLRIGQEDTDG